MKVLYFHQHFSTPHGSTGIRSYQMAQELIRQGHQITMVCGSYGGGKTGLNTQFKKGKRRGEVDGIDVIEFDLAYSNTDGLVNRAWTFIKFALQSIKVAFTEKYDVAFATSTPLTAGIPGIFARWFRRKKFVFEVRDLWPELPREMGVIQNPIVLWLLSCLEWSSYRSAHRCIGLSPGIVKGIEKRGVAPDKITLVPNGCDLQIFNHDEIQAWRPEGVAENDLMAVFTGTHGMANGLDSVLSAGEELQRRGRDDIKLVFIGQGKLKPSLVEEAKTLGLKNTLFLDPVNKLKLAEFLAGADIGMQTLANVPAFYYGTSPNKFFDYISAGLPVLNNYPGWLAEMIESESCGFVVEPDNPLSFADALEQAADNRELLPAMGRNARSLAEKKFDRLELSKKWVSWVEGVL